MWPAPRLKKSGICGRGLSWFLELRTGRSRSVPGYKLHRRTLTRPALTRQVTASLTHTRGCLLRASCGAATPSTGGAGCSCLQHRAAPRRSPRPTETRRRPPSRCQVWYPTFGAPAAEPQPPGSRRRSASAAARAARSRSVSAGVRSGLLRAPEAGLPLCCLSFGLVSARRLSCQPIALCSAAIGFPIMSAHMSELGCNLSSTSDSAGQHCSGSCLVVGKHAGRGCTCRRTAKARQQGCWHSLNKPDVRYILP